MKLSLTRRSLMIFTIAIACVGICLAFTHTSARKHANKNYSGEALFEGIIFMQGDVANQLPFCSDMKELSAKSHAGGQTDAVIEEIMTALRKENPKYFDHFKAVMTSGDVTAIDQELLAAANLIKSKRMVLQQKTQPAPVVASGVLLPVGDVIDYNIDLGPTGINFEVVVAWAGNKENKTRLQREILVSQIVANLSIS